MADEDEEGAVNVSKDASQVMREEILDIDEKIRRLLAVYLDKDIEREVYCSQRAELLSRKKALKEKITDLERGAIAWLEPLRKWINDSKNAGETAVSPDLFAKKSSALKLSGSNPLLQNKKIRFVPILPRYC